MGLLCCTVPEEYGGLGLDYLFDVVVFEELWRVGASGPGFLIHTDLVATYLLSFGTQEQKLHWLPKMVRGEAIGSLGMTEPHAGSDLKAVRTHARRHGDDFVINGQKVFISNGQLVRRHRSGDEDRFRRGREGRHAVSGGIGPARLYAWAQSRKARHEGAGHVRIVLRGRSHSRVQHAGRRGTGLRLDDDEVAAGAPRAGDPLGDRHRNRHRMDG